MAVVLPSALAATVARSCASDLLSPSIAYCNRQTVGICHELGMDDSSLRAIPPPGMNGICQELPSERGTGDNGEE